MFFFCFVFFSNISYLGYCSYSWANCIIIQLLLAFFPSTYWVVLAGNFKPYLTNCSHYFVMLDPGLHASLSFAVGWTEDTHLGRSAAAVAATLQWRRDNCPNRWANAPTAQIRSDLQSWDIAHRYNFFSSSFFFFRPTMSHEFSCLFVGSEKSCVRPAQPDPVFRLCSSWKSHPRQWDRLARTGVDM